MGCILKRSWWIAQAGALAAVLAYGQLFTPAGVADIPELYSDFVPSWTGGVLVSIENRNTATPIIHSFDETGQEILPIAFSIPDAQTIYIEGYSRGEGGVFALAGWTLDRENHRGCFLSLVSPDHKTIQTVRPAPYYPRLVAVAPDGTIWTVGMELNSMGSEKDPAVNLKHGVVRHFDRNLVEIGSVLSRSAVKPVRGGYLVSSKDRIGWYDRLSLAYYEVTFDGKVSQFPGIPLQPKFSLGGFALTDDGNAFVTIGRLNAGVQLYRLDRSTSGWVPIGAPTGTQITTQGDTPRVLGPELFGGAGNRLAFRGYDGLTGWKIKFFNVGGGEGTER